MYRLCIIFALEWLYNAALMFLFSAHFSIGIKQITMLSETLPQTFKNDSCTFPAALSNSVALYTQMS